MFEHFTNNVIADDESNGKSKTIPSDRDWSETEKDWICVPGNKIEHVCQDAKKVASEIKRSDAASYCDYAIFPGNGKASIIYLQWRQYLLQSSSPRQ